MLSILILLVIVQKHYVWKLTEFTLQTTLCEEYTNKLIVTIEGELLNIGALGASD